VTDPAVAASFRASFDQANQAFSDAYDSDDEGALESTIEGLWEVAATVQEYVDGLSDNGREEQDFMSFDEWKAAAEDADYAVYQDPPNSQNWLAGSPTNPRGFWDGNSGTLKIG
jgi:hypothetical protein